MCFFSGGSKELPKETLKDLYRQVLLFCATTFSLCPCTFPSIVYLVSFCQPVPFFFEKKGMDRKKGTDIDCLSVPFFFSVYSRDSYSP